jgi:hypothetical protein
VLLNGHGVFFAVADAMGGHLGVKLPAAWQVIDSATPSKEE